MMKQLLNYFLNGLLLVLPVAATYIVLSYAIIAIDGIIPTPIPGVGLLVVLTIITFLGYLGRNVMAKPILNFIIGIIERAPVINIIYKSTREFAEAFLGTDRKLDKPVLFDVYDNETYRVGFITQESMTHLGLPDYVGVYVPHSYNFSGNFFMVKRSRTRALTISSTEAMRFAVTGGVVNLGPNSKSDLKS